MSIEQKSVSYSRAFNADTTSEKKKAGTPSETGKHDDLPEGFANLSEASREHVQKAIDIHRRYLQDGDLIPPTFIIEKDKSVVLLPMDGSSQQAKEISADTARRIASLSNSEFVAFVSIAWVLPESQLQNASAILAKYGSIKKCPRSLKRAQVNLETRKGRYFALVPILACPPSKKRKTLGQVVWHRSDNVRGTLTGILPLDSER